MKKSLILVGMLSIGYAYAQEGNVGINTDNPRATLEITPSTPNLTGTTNEGILVPRLSKERVAKMATPETSTLVYVNDITYTASNTATPADIRVALVDAVGYYQYNGKQWERIGSEPWKVYGTDKYATQNNQNIYQKGNVVVSTLNIPTYFSNNMGETFTETTTLETKYNTASFISYGEKRALNNSFFGKNYSSLNGGDLYISSRGKSDGENIGATARIMLNVGPEDSSKSYSSFYIFKYGGDQTPGKTAVTGTYFINKDLYGSVLHFTEEGSFHFRNSANGRKYFTHEGGTVVNIHQDGNVGIGTVASVPTNRLHVKANADPLRLEGLKTGTGEVLVVDANGIIKKGSVEATTAISGLQNIVNMECNTTNRGKMNFVQDVSVNGKTFDAFGICLKGNDDKFYWRYLYGADGETTGIGNFGTGLN